MQNIKAKITLLTTFVAILALLVIYDTVSVSLSEEVSVGMVQSELSKKEISNSIVRPKEKIYLPKDITLEDTSGNTFLIFDEKLQKAQIINFWASWCAPCLKELPSLFKLADEYKDTLRVLAISVDENVKGFDKVVTKLKAEHRNSSVIIARDTKKVSKNIFNTTKVPETFLIQANGEITGKAVGYVDWQQASVCNYIDIIKLLACSTQVEAEVQMINVVKEVINDKEVKIMGAPTSYSVSNTEIIYE